MIPFNKPYLHGDELVYIAQAAKDGKISGDGKFTKKCHEFFEKNTILKKYYLLLLVLTHLKWQQYCWTLNQEMK